jgi:hypothetical protein
MSLSEFTQTVLNIATGAEAIKSLLQKTTELIVPFKELVDRLLDSTSCNEDKQHLMILREKLKSFEEQYKKLQELISQSEMVEKWLSENRESLANQSAKVVATKYALKHSDESEISERITDYLYLIQQSLRLGRPNVMDRHFDGNRSFSLRLPPAYYREALHFIIDETASNCLSPEVTRTAKAYFEHLMKKLDSNA